MFLGALPDRPGAGTRAGLDLVGCDLAVRVEEAVDRVGVDREEAHAVGTLVRVCLRPRRSPRARLRRDHPQAQGATCDHALVLVDETMSKEAIYTAMSRDRQLKDLYLAIDTGRDDIPHAPEITHDPVDALVAGIKRSAAQQMAIDRL
jgi:hypothetical protein